MLARRDVATSAALSVALHCGLLAALILTPQLFKPKFRELPSLGVITATIEGTGGGQRSGARPTRPEPAPLPEQPAPPIAKAPPRPAPPPAPAPDLTLPGARPPRPPSKVAKADLRPDLAPARRQTHPTPAPTALPADRGLTSRNLEGSEPSLDVTKKDAGGPGVTGVGVDPLLYYYARIKEKVSTFWLPSQRPDQDIQVLVGIRLLPGGQVRDITIEASSGDRAFDEAAVRALRQALPLPPFPPLVKDESLNLILRFNNRGVGG